MSYAQPQQPGSSHRSTNWVALRNCTGQTGPGMGFEVNLGGEQIHNPILIAIDGSQIMYVSVIYRSQAP